MIPANLQTWFSFKDNLINQHKPDMVIFRNFCPSEYWANANEIIWYQEYNPTLLSGYRLPRTFNINVTKIATQNKIDASIKNNFWFPYCVSKNWEIPNTNRDIPILIASNVPQLNLPALPRGSASAGSDEIVGASFNEVGSSYGTDFTPAASYGDDIDYGGDSIEIG